MKRERDYNMLLEEQTNDDSRTLPDETILARSLRHPGLFRILVERYEDAFLRKAQAIVRSHEEAEDIVQETFTKIYLNARRFTPREGASFRSWAYKILLNTTFSHYQKLKQRGLMHVELDPELYETLPDPTNYSEEETMRDYVASFLAQMPGQLARPLKLHFIDDYSQKEIAAIEGTTVSAIKTKIYRAKRELAKLFKNKHL